MTNQQAPSNEERIMKTELIEIAYKFKGNIDCDFTETSIESLLKLIADCIDAQTQAPSATVDEKPPIFEEEMCSKCFTLLSRKINGVEQLHSQQEKRYTETVDRRIVELHEEIRKERKQPPDLYPDFMKLHDLWVEVRTLQNLKQYCDKFDTEGK